MKTRKRRATLAALAVLALSSALAAAQGSSPAASQGTPSATAFAPFPSRLRAAVKGNLVILTWTDSADVKGKYVVYRSDSALRADTLPSATRLGEVPTGAQTYTDTPPDSKPYFYAVLALADDGTPYQVFMPSKNASSVGIAVNIAPLSTVLAATSPVAPLAPVASATPASPSPAVKPAAGAPATPSPTAQPAPAAGSQAFVSALSAKAKGDAIVLSYKASPKSRLVVYRGSTQLLGAADLLDATLVAAFTDKEGSFVDYPVPGVDYYYAILGEEDLKAGRINIAAGVNSLTSPTQVRAAAYPAGFAETPPAARTPPLPYFLMEDGGSGRREPPPQEEGPPPLRAVSAETQKAIASILERAPKVAPSMPATTILAEEHSAPSGGEDYALSLIVSDRIASRDWAGAADQLRKYLSLNRGPKASARARFYLGEALAFAGSSREAFFEFLSAREFYPIETKPWIEYVLATLQGS
jgi:hypothetical protein